MSRYVEVNPDDYRRFAVDDVIDHGDSLTLKYSGKIFGGILTDALTPAVRAAIRPGCEILVLLHGPETGHPGQVAHVLIANPDGGGWAELYADY